MAVKKSELYSLLWEACNKLRGGVEPARYKDYVLVLLFFKYVSDRYKGQKFAEFTISKGASFEDLIEAKGKSDVGERADKIIQKFLEDNQLIGSLPDVSFNNADELGSGKELVDKVSGLIGVFQNPAIDFKNNRASGDDIIGDAYEYFMMKFAQESGKSKGQFYTPSEVSRIIARLTGQVLFGGKVYKKFTANLTVSVPDTVIPSISSVAFSDVDDSAVPSSWGIYVQGQSGLKLKSISCTGAYGSEIKKVKMTADSRIRTTDYPELPEMDHISQSGEVSVMVTVTDSRNRTVNKSAVVSVVSYASPKLSSVKSERCNASGETDNDGTYFLSTTSAVFPSCLGKNALTLTVKYKRTDLKNYGNEVQINPGSNVCANNDLDPEYSCDVLYTLSDEFNTVTYSDFVSTAVYLMHFLHGGRTTSRSCS